MNTIVLNNDIKIINFLYNDEKYVINFDELLFFLKENNQICSNFLYDLIKNFENKHQPQIIHSCDIEMRNITKISLDLNESESSNMKLEALNGDEHRLDLSENQGYIYIIREREFLNMNEDVYKIGRTENFIRRFSQYPKNSEVVFTIKVENPSKIESELIKKLKQIIKHRRDIGNEYFEGDRHLITNTIYEIIQKYSKKVDKIIVSSQPESDIVEDIIKQINEPNDEFMKLSDIELIKVASVLLVTAKKMKITEYYKKKSIYFRPFNLVGLVSNNKIECESKRKSIRELCRKCKSFINQNREVLI